VCLRWIFPVKISLGKIFSCFSASAVAATCIYFYKGRKETQLRTYNDPQPPSCGIYMKRLDARNSSGCEAGDVWRGVCSNVITESNEWPPKVVANFLRLSMVLQYEFIHCSHQTTGAGMYENRFSLSSVWSSFNFYSILFTKLWKQVNYSKKATKIWKMTFCC